MTSSLHYFTANAAEALRLADALGIDGQPVATRRFPDGESLVRVGLSNPAALLYCSLDNPNAKLVEVLLAASALRDGGARQVVLVAPYLGYMRQDQAFSPGEAVSQRVIGGLLTSAFNGLVTVDPHLHRTPLLEDVVPGIVAINVSAAATIAKALKGTITEQTLLVGPDEESRPWVENVGSLLGLEVMVGIKQRHGDRKVAISFPDIERASARPVMLVDDVISSGATLIACANQLRDAGATMIGAVATHCLAGDADLALLNESGITTVLATDTVPGAAACIPMASTLAAVIREHSLGQDGWRRQK